jgi:hypothetical protein
MIQSEVRENVSGRLSNFPHARGLATGLHLQRRDEKVTQAKREAEADSNES